MSERSRKIVLIILLSLGFLLLFTGSLADESPLEIQQYDIKNEFNETITNEEIIKQENSDEIYDYTNTEQDITQTYNYSELNESAKSDIDALLDGESNIYSYEFEEGVFIIHNNDENTSYFFEALDTQLDPLWLSFYGVFILLTAILLYKTQYNTNDEDNTKNMNFDGIKVADEDSEWDYEIIDDDI